MVLCRAKYGSTPALMVFGRCSSLPAQREEPSKGRPARSGISSVCCVASSPDLGRLEAVAHLAHVCASCAAAVDTGLISTLQRTYLPTATTNAGA